MADDNAPNVVVADPSDTGPTLPAAAPVMPTQGPIAGAQAQEPDPNPIAGATPAAQPSTVQGANGPVTVNTANPDFNQDKSVPETAPPAAGVKSVWKDIVMGALHGLAGSAGAKHFGGGLAGGAQGEFAAKQQEVENAQNATKLQFESVAAADKHIEATQEHARANVLSDQEKLNYAKSSAEYQAYLQDNFGIEPDLSFNDSHPEAIGALGTSAQANGGKIPPVVTVQQPAPDGTHGTIAAYSPSNEQMRQNSAGYRDAVNQSRRVQGLPDVDNTSWNSLGFKGQRDQAQAAIADMKPTPAFSLDKSKPDYLPVVLATKQQQLKQYQAHKDANGNADANPATVKQLQAGIDFLQSSWDTTNKAETAQAAALTTAQQTAMIPFKEQDQRFQSALQQQKSVFDSQLSDSKTRNQKADEMTLKENQTRDSDLKNIGDLKDNLKQINAGNQVALGTAQVKFAEHEIVEGGVKRMNQTELSALTSGTGTYARQVDAWASKGFQGNMPKASQADMLQILQNETDSRNALHDKNVASIDGLIRPQSTPITSKGRTSNQPQAPQFKRGTDGKVQKSTDGGKTWQ
jgi:hypothetical protein